MNGAIKTKNTALGKLMSDFFCTDAKDMCYEELSDKVVKYSGLPLEKVRELADEMTA